MQNAAQSEDRDVLSSSVLESATEEYQRHSAEVNPVITIQPSKHP